MSRLLQRFTLHKTMTLIASQGTIQTVISQCYISHEHGGKNLGFTICKLSVKGLNWECRLSELS